MNEEWGVFTIMVEEREPGTLLIAKRKIFS
jgi:hypothetical protein